MCSTSKRLWRRTEGQQQVVPTSAVPAIWRLRFLAAVPHGSSWPRARRQLVPRRSHWSTQLTLARYHDDPDAARFVHFRDDPGRDGCWPRSPAPHLDPPRSRSWPASPQPRAAQPITSGEIPLAAAPGWHPRDHRPQGRRVAGMRSRGTGSVLRGSVERPSPWGLRCRRTLARSTPAAPVARPWPAISASRFRVIGAAADRLVEVPTTLGLLGLLEAGPTLAS